MKTAKKLTALLIVLTLLFTLSATAFATAGTAFVKFYIPNGVVSIPSDYSIAGVDASYKLWYSHNDSVNMTNITGCTVTLPSGFQGATLPSPTDGTTYAVTVFDVLYMGGTAAQGTFSYGFDTYNSPNGIYVDTLSGIGTITQSSSYDPNTGHGSWSGYSWNLYVVPAGATFNPLNHDSTYLASLYANNIAAIAGATYYMILEFSSYTF